MNNPSNAWNPTTLRTDPPRSRGFLVLVIALMIGWVSVTGWFVTTTKTVGSPDEAANQYFMRHLAATGQYRVDSGLPSETNQLLYPRSAMRLGADLASGSFLGLVQAGAGVIKVFGVGSERFLTPVLALLALIAAYLVLRRFWDRTWALLTTVLIAVHPAWFGQMTAPYLHNGAFTALLVVSGWALLRLLERPTPWRSVLMGIVFGASLYFRPIEVIWLAPIVAVILIARKSWWPLFIVGALTAIAQLPWLLVNHQLFGAWLSSAYTPSGIFTGGEDVAEVVTAPAKLLFTPPGGAWSWHWLSSVWWYLIVLGSPVSALALIAEGQYLRRAVKGIKAFKLGLIALPIIFLLVYYGTWDLYPVSTASQVGWLASYVRYWLIIYVALCIGASLALQKMFNRKLAIGAMVAVIGLQILTTVGHVNSGIVHRLAADRTGRDRQTFILQQTEADSLVIAGQQDKYLFGQRRVAFAWPTSEAGFQAVQKTVVNRSVYLYGTLNQFSDDRLRSQLAPYGLTLGSVKRLGSDSLWQILPKL